jgi:hypothetical protein
MAAMAWFKKKSDPLSERARALSSQIASIEAEIKRLDARLQRGPSSPREPHAVPPSAPASPDSSGELPAAQPPPAPRRAEAPVFEDMAPPPLEAQSELGTTPDHYNELGVRKYDLPALLRRLRNHFRGPSTTNPKLVSYLAAGGIQGLRPLRYEKRVARNRFIALVIILFLTLLGIVAVFVRQL